MKTTQTTLRVRRFDEGFFSPQAIGNLPNPAGSFVTSPTANLATANRPRQPRSSLLIRPTKSMSACPYVMSPTLNSFAAFSAEPDTPVAEMPTDLLPVQAGYTYSPTTGSYYDPSGNPVTKYDIPAVAPVASGASTTSPAATTGNSILDAIGGAIKTVAAPAAQAIAPKAAKPGKTVSDKQLMQQYLQGKLPGYEINPQTGQLQKKSNVGVIVVVGAVAVGLLFFGVLSRK